MSEQKPTVAVIGLGRMGSAMARRFHGGGYDLTLWNRDRGKAQSVASETGSDVALSAADAASAADIVLTSLADDAALEEVYLGADGIVAGIEAGSVAVDTSTVHPATVVKVGEAVDGTGAGLIDCPVSGSVSTVESGMLTVMAGGDATLISRVEPLLETIAKRVIRVGGRGAGAACKLAVNGLVHGLNVALSEALVLAEKAGVDREKAYEVFSSGAGGAPFVEYKRDAYLHPEAAAVAFTLDLVAKDLDLITQLGSEVGAPMDQATTGLDIVNRAIESGLAGRDLSAIAVFLRGKEG
ncbi:MAG TPA: NAD(P)-dependent oxidoreductase [Acidimicrobiia bacterium]|nr:NAD(P)-dependent oxidoreductase [Acidimicrobiia bacterium]